MNWFIPVYKLFIPTYENNFVNIGTFVWKLEVELQKYAPMVSLFVTQKQSHKGYTWLWNIQLYQFYT